MGIPFLPLPAGATLLIYNDVDDDDDEEEDGDSENGG